jgi:hypothetical protein
MYREGSGVKKSVQEFRESKALRFEDGECPSNNLSV